MSKFSEYQYIRPVFGEMEQTWKALLQEFKTAADVAKQNQIMQKINVLRNSFETMQTLVEIRHTMDTSDAFYDAENDYFDEVRPDYDGLVDEFYQALMNSPFRAELEQQWGSLLFELAAMKLRTFKPEILGDLQEENKLTSQYTKLRASAQVEFDGEIYNLPQLEPFMESINRETRRRAHQAYYSFFKAHEAEFDEIYDRLVKVRTKIAKALGFENFIELGYARMSRIDYNAEQVAEYRRQIRESWVPFTVELRQAQAKRLGLSKLNFYDEVLQFSEGNPVPQGTSAEIIAAGEKMYTEMSKETAEFFKFMTEHELLDLETRRNKAGGGYCTYLSDYRSPFIFSNFNGTSGDVDVLTHEAGHAFQAYMGRDTELPEYLWPTMESCEIHSMSMEFFAWPWMQLFFGNEFKRYCFSHLSGAILFLPYGATVDEFQHWVYENPTVSPAERKAKWREIERGYLPLRDFDDNEFLERGGYWFRQGHIFEVPFYYIDYTLAQVCALQFLLKANKNHAAAWEDYLHLCKLGGSKSFLKLVNEASLNNPFVDGTLDNVVKELKKAKFLAPFL